MKKIIIALIGLLYLHLSSFAQSIDFSKSKLVPVQSKMAIIKMEGKTVLKVIKDSSVKAVDQPTFVRITGPVFHNGTIEVKVLSRLLKNASPMARGFIGVAFRIDELNTKYESIYVRPTNGRADDQVRRNHSVQYYSFPDYPFSRLRKESPEMYETHADIGLDEWTNLRITVTEGKAQLFIGNTNQPVLIVNDLKLGPDSTGAVALWVDVGTEGYFKDLKITPLP